MLALTPLAQEKLTAYLAESKLEPKVRVQISSGCCGGDEGQLILTPDPPAPGDIFAEFGSLTLSLSRDLYEQVGRVRVDFRDEGHDSGFIVESERSPAAAGCAGCTT
ncbi:MAG: hypothetical protein LBV21_02295, partial [Candidatus Adiutrix sp.]|nr:hypothetical protein [Candidatus Adiutrix sp.]